MPVTPRHPQSAAGQSFVHSSVPTPPVPTRMQIVDWHCLPSVHGSPNPFFGASGLASIAGGASPAVPVDTSALHVADSGSHWLLGREVAHAAANASPPQRTRLIAAKLTRWIWCR